MTTRDGSGTERTAMRRILYPLLAVAGLGLFGWYLYASRAHFLSNWRIDWGPAVGIGLLTALAVALRGFANRWVFRGLGVHASAGAWFGLTSAASLSNYLPGPAGLVAKGVFLKRVHDLPYPLYAQGQAELTLLFLATGGAVGLATLPLLSEVPWELAIAFAGMAGTAALLFLPGRVVERFVPRLGDPRRFARQTGLARVWPFVVAAQVGSLLAVSAKLWIAFRMGPEQTGFAVCVVLVAGSMLTRLAPITPGALGVREFLIGALAYLAGLDLRDAVIASSIDRVIDVVVIFALGGGWIVARSRRSPAGG